MITQKILVVDDEQTVCDSIKKILSRRGYTVDNTLDPENAVEKLKETSYDLVITDLMMPKMDGMELLKIIKDYYPELEVIVITGYASIDSAVQATKLGATDYLPKPFTPEELAEITNKALDRTLAYKKNKAKEPEKKAVVEYYGDIIDVDMPFSESEVAKRTSKEYVERLTHSDIPVIKKPEKKTAYCILGKRECRRLVLEGRECIGECPIEKKAKARQVKKLFEPVTRSVEIIDIDQPFNLSEIEQTIGIDYANCLDRSDIPRAALYGRDATAKHNVLVVDDEPIVCHSLRRILSKQSCMVEEAFDVDTATQKMKLNKYDLVFLDLKMPKRSGMEVLQSIRKYYPDTPVIMITGYASIKTAVEATKMGAFHFLAKPFTPDELKEVAMEALAA
jgi:DNA-binding NtrC family response regulator